MVVIYKGDNPIGFCVIKINYNINCDLYVLGLLPEYHHKGLGTKMIKFIEDYCRREKIFYMSVKTMSEKSTDKNYAKTRKFYEKCGFASFEEIPDFWGKNCPCLIMIKDLI